MHSYFFFVPNTDDDSRTHLGKLKVSLKQMGLSVLVLKTTYNNIFIMLVSFIVKFLSVSEVHRGNHRLATSHCQTYKSPLLATGIYFDLSGPTKRSQ